jgi:hypothetical protein
MVSSGRRGLGLNQTVLLELEHGYSRLVSPWEGALCRTSGGRRSGSHPQIIEKFGRRFNTRDD